MNDYDINEIRNLEDKHLTLEKICEIKNWKLPALSRWLKRNFHKTVTKKTHYIKKQKKEGN